MPSGTYGDTTSMTACLTDPTSDKVAPDFRAGPISAMTAAIAPTGTQSTTRSASLTASAAVSVMRSHRLISAAMAARWTLRSGPARSARFSRKSPPSPCPFELRDPVDDPAAGAFVAHRDAQAMGQFVACNPADQNAFGFEVIVAGICLLC